MLDRRGFFFGCVSGSVVGTIATTAQALEGPPGCDAQPTGALFIQVACRHGLPALTDPSQSAGRVEVTIRGEFVGCALASFHMDQHGEITLLPMFLGYLAHGRREDVKVQLFDELGRLCRHEVLITEMKK